MNDVYSIDQLALNTDWMKENLARHLWQPNEVGGEVLNVEIKYKLASPKRGFLFYEIELSDVNKGTVRQSYTGYLIPRNRRLWRQFKLISKKGRLSPGVGKACIFVKAARLILLAMPNTRKMHLLSAQELHSWLDENLSEVVNGELDGASWQVTDADVEMLRYVPDKRYTARCRVALTSDTGLQKEITFIAKQFKRPNKTERLYNFHHGLQLEIASSETATHGRAARNSHIRLPRALALDIENKMAFVEDISGENLKESLSESDSQQVLAAVGKLLANFHRLKTRVETTVSIATELDDVREANGIITKVLPGFRKRLDALLHGLETLKCNDAAAETLLHGSFRLNHLHLHEGELVPLDLDSLRMGHPAYDLANFLSSLYYLEAQGRIACGQRAEMTRYFLLAYTSEAPWVVSPSSIFWFLVSLLINKQAKKFVTHLHKDQEQRVERMLVAAEQALERCRDGTKAVDVLDIWKELT